VNEPTAPRQRTKVRPWALMAVAALSLLSLSLGREDFNYGAETDFLGSFVPDAERIRAGRAPRVQFHPPLYPAALALAYSITNDWLRAGLLLSAFGALLVLISSVRLFGRRYGPAAGVGAAVGLCLSDVFVSYAQQATGDVFFTGLLLASVAILANDHAGPARRVLAGVLMGLAILSRTNGVAALPFALLLWRGNAGWRGPLRRLTPYLGGVALPVLIWLGLSAHIGAPFLPSETHTNLALTYLAEGDRTSGDARNTATEGLDNTADVLRRISPGRGLRIYIRDLLRGIKNVFTLDLMVFPAAQLLLPGLVLLLMRLWERRDYGLLLGVAGMFLTLHLKAWESRYHLYLVPFFGASLGLLGSMVIGAARRTGRERGLALAAACLLAFAGVEMLRVQHEQRGGLSHDARAAARVLDHYAPGPLARIVARKPHLCHYASIPCVGFPEVADIAELGQQLAALDADTPRDGELFLFYGYAEKLLRPGLSRLGRRDLDTPWLQRIGLGKETGKWVLYRVNRNLLPRRGADVGRGVSMSQLP